ncbi:MAG: GLUG motif-containing protein [Ruminococcus sp.]
MTKKLKRPLAFLSAFVMIMAMMLYFPSGMFSSTDWGLKASAADYQLNVDINLYSNYESGSTITLTKDIVGESSLVIDGKTLTFDLNGNTLTVACIILMSNADVTFKNGILQTPAEPTAAVITAISSKVTLENIAVLSGDAKDLNSGWDAVALNGTSELNATSAFLKGGSLTFDDQLYLYPGAAICFDQNGSASAKLTNTTLALGDGGDYKFYGTFSPVSGNGTITNGADDSTVTVRSYNSEYNNLPLVIGNGYHYNGCTGVYDQMVIESKYKCEDADCQNYAWYWYSCACGQKGTDSFEDEEGGCIDHNLIIVGDTPTQHIYQCSMCLNTFKENHSGGTATCTEKAKCSVCNQPYGDYAHTFNNDGFCETCGGYQPADLKNGVYEISNAGQLYWFAGLVNGTLTDGTSQNKSANAVLTADITVNTGVLDENGDPNGDNFTSWTPIGTTYNKTYMGTFDGQNHTISGLYFNNTDSSTGKFVGLFGYVGSGVKVSNISVVDSYFSGYQYVSGVCGVNYGTITNCYNLGTVSGSDDYVGGVCGVNYGSITGCYNTGKVSGSNYCGGVCGCLRSGIITNCYNTGSVTSKGSGYAGGVCGYSDSGTITNCYNTGEVSGSNYCGGVCGRNYSTITNCYNDSSKCGEAVNTNPGTVTDVENKTTTQFGSGEVAYLLSQGCTVDSTTYKGDVWGQTIGTEDYPVLGGKKVLANVDLSDFANDIIIYGQSATLDGTIGFNIYVAADDDYIWTASIDGEEVAKPEKDENGLYKFTYQVAAKDMDENINFTVNDKIDVTVSVSDYIAELSETDDESLKKLAESMSAYGDAAKAFFSNGTVAEQTITDDLSLYDFTVAMPEGISYYGSSLILESETTIRHYFTIADGYDADSFTFGAGNESGKPVAKQGYYYVDIKNISAEKLGNAFTVSVNGSTVISNYSALSYVNKVLSSDSTDDNLKNLVKALYIYNRNAIAYNEAQKEDLK